MFASAETKDGIVDIVSSGSPFFMLTLFGNATIRLLGQKSQKDIYLENQIIKKLHENVGKKIHQVWHNRSVPPGGFQSKEESEILLQEAFKKSYSSIVQEVKRIMKESDLKEGEPLENLKIKAKIKNLEFETDQNGVAYMKRETEESIIGQLEKGEEIFLSYFHIHRYVRQFNGRQGFLELPNDVLSKEEAEKTKKGGPHGVTVVDVIRDPSQKIKYLVVKNSWGSLGKSDRGYHYISVEYLKNYGGTIYIWDIVPN